MILNRVEAGTILKDLKNKILKTWEITARREIHPRSDWDHRTLLNHLPIFLQQLSEALQNSSDERISCRELQFLGFSHGLERSLSRQSNLGAVLREFQHLQNLILASLEHNQNGDIATLDFESRQIILDSIQTVIQMAAETFHTEDKQKEVVRERDFLNAVLENSVDGIAACDSSGKLTVFNSANRNFHGLPSGLLQTADLVKGYRIFDSLNSQPLAVEQLPLFRALRGEKLKDVQLSIQDFRGQIRQFLSSGQPVRNADGDILGAVITMHDITALKETDQNRAALAMEKQKRQLAEDSRNKVDHILESISDAFMSIDLNWKFTYLNSHAERLIGQSKESLIDKEIWLELPDWRDSRLELQMRKSLADKEPLSFDQYHLLLQRWFQLKIYPSDCGLSVYFQDITNYKRIQDKLRARQEWFQTTLQCMGDGLIATKSDADGSILFMNSVAEQLTGWTFADIQTKPLLSILHLLHERTEQKMESPIVEVLKDQTKDGAPITLKQDCLLKSRSGRIFRIQLSASPIRNRNGRIEGVVMVFRDTTEQSALEVAKDRFAAFIEHSKGSVGMFGTNQQLVFLNPESRSLLGLEESDSVENISILDFFAPAERARLEQIVLPKIFRRGQWTGEVWIRHFKTGAEIPIAWSVFSITDSETGNISGYGWTSKTLIEQKKLEAEKAHDREMIMIERNRLSRLFDQAPLPIFVTQGPEHTYILANPAFMKAFAPDRQIIGKTLKEAWPELVDNSFVQRMNRVYQSGQTHQGLEIPLKLHQANNIVKQGYFNFVYHPIKNGQEQTIGVLVLAMDVTTQVLARQSLVESEQRFRLLADSMPQLVWTSHASGELDYCSRGWTEFTGISESELLGNGWKKVIHQEDHPLVLASWEKALEKKEILNCEYRIRSSGGSYHWFLTRGVPLINCQKEVIKWYGTCTDIHEQKKLAEDLKQATDQAEAANSTKSVFLANMSHEIRTPLNAILGFTELLKNSCSSEKEQKEFIEIISRNGYALTHLIDDILDLSKVEAGKLEIEKVAFSVTDLIHEIFNLFSTKIQSKGLQLTADIRPQVPRYLLSDPTRIRQILINIIGNAVKFTDSGLIHIVVHAVSLYESEHQIEISVEDSGPGLSPGQKERLFQVFAQGDSSATRKFGGTGLGLALSKRLANALGGDIEITRCEPQKGCTFLITFRALATLAPNSIEPERNRDPDLDAKKGFENTRVLVVDDMQDNLMLVRKVLSRWGVTVDIAHDGQEGIDKALSGDYDVVLMDLQMPLMDGYEAVRKLREFGYQKPVLALTAHAMDEERIKTLQAGYNGHLTKPLNTKELLKTLNQYSKRNPSLQNHQQSH